MIVSSFAGAFPVALERDVRPFSLVRAALDGRPLVVWRDNAGQIRVWEDNCPHRSIRLSAGRNLGDCIEDAYHGWRFDSEGRLVLIPSLKDEALPEVSARVLSSAVASGLVWASIEGPAEVPHFTIEDDEVMVRPLPFRVNAYRVAGACVGIEGARLMVTPTGANSATVFGFAARRLGTDDAAAAWRVNTQLSAIRRKVEG